MNVTIYQPKGVYSQFGMKPAPTQDNVLAKGTVTPKQEDAKRGKRKKAALITLAVAGATALGVFVAYYKKNSKILKWPEVDSLIGLSEEEFTQVNRAEYKEDYFKDLLEKRRIYKECKEGTVGKIKDTLARISGYFERHFYNY